MRPRILVTGATGFIGRALVSHLVEQADVTLLLLEEFASGLRLPDPLPSLRGQVDAVYADLRNYQVTSRAIRQANPDRVIHLAAAGVTDPFLNVHTALSHNVVGTVNLLRACFEAGNHNIRQLIVARTPGERTAMNVYAASKLAAWDFCRMYVRTAHWPIHGAMIFQAYGPGQPAQLLVPAAVAAAIAGANFPMTSGRQSKDWIHIDDIVAGFMRLATAELEPGATVELGTGIATDVSEVVRQIYELVGRGGRPLTGVLPRRPGEDDEQMADAVTTARLIGWQAQITLAEGLARVIEDTRRRAG
jgi:nucleoside-diphosphate-sugar epimerase